MKYGVYNSDKPATSEHFDLSRGNGWDNHLFDSFEDAKVYASNWLGQYGGLASNLKINVKCDYSGYGDTIEIREMV